MLELVGLIQSSFFISTFQHLTLNRLHALHELQHDFHRSWFFITSILWGLSASLYSSGFEPWRLSGLWGSFGLLVGGLSLLLRAVVRLTSLWCLSASWLGVSASFGLSPVVLRTLDPLQIGVAAPSQDVQTFSLNFLFSSKTSSIPFFNSKFSRPQLPSICVYILRTHTNSFLHPTFILFEKKRSRNWRLNGWLVECHRTTGYSQGAC